MGGTTSIRGGSSTGSSSGASGADAARRAEEARQRAEAARKAAEAARKAAEAARRAAEAARLAQEKARAEAAKAKQQAQQPGQTPEEQKASRKEAEAAAKAQKVAEQRASKADEALRAAEEKAARTARQAQGAMGQANVLATQQGLAQPFDDKSVNGVKPRAATSDVSSFDAAPRREGMDKLLGNVPSPTGSAEGSTLLTEDAKDGKVNCLDVAADWVDKASPELRARSEMVFLQDQRPGAEGQTGHVVVRQGEQVLDPTTNQSYESMEAYKKAQPQYQEVGSVPATDAQRIFDTPPGSPERAAELEKAKLSPELRNMMVADASPAEQQAWDRYDAHVKAGPPKDLPQNMGLRQELLEAHAAKTKELADAANKASVERLRTELGSTPEGKKALEDLDARGVGIHVVDDASYARLPGAGTDGHALPGNGDITLSRKGATVDVLQREAQRSAETQQLKLPTTPEDGERLAVSVSETLKANPRQPVEFEDGGIHVVAMRNPKASLVENGGSVADVLGLSPSFTEEAQAAGKQPGSDTIVNTSFYDFAAWGTNPVGQVVKNGEVIAGNSDPDRFYAAWTDSGMKFGQGDPPKDANVAFGGAVPVIIDGTPYGVGNQYKPGTDAAAPDKGDPGAFSGDLTQRNNESFRAQEERGKEVGKVIVGYDRDTGTTYVVAQEDGSKPGKTLSEIRDALVKLGVDDAVSFDGSDSATLVRDDQVKVEPGWAKNQTIPYGLRLSLGE
ncbi:phosphodiester glycosidase family protein [Myxococcus sp. XM-1-1-1]|uniref:phosphodiester glycosidase family protein n=1 Tax=Myxococcus sp. XM-1-1-1 TaxID=2874602 RepID=UPI001CC0493E|nr:phosphodiester glycosidase family protein [Myxococcus sp. XM-1-1-1]MBZ4413305.1 phosphodiester glycosidase family protein [Myxococcus sp. XM-1-1-1]